MLYLDSSALVKRYVAEAGSARVQAAIAADPDVATSIVSRVEVHAALAAAARPGRIAQLGALVSLLRADWAMLAVIGIDAQLAEDAATLAERHALRGYDAVQLASAMLAASAARASGSAFVFATFDLTLGTAAVAAGLPLLS